MVQWRGLARRAILVTVFLVSWSDFGRGADDEVFTNSFVVQTRDGSDAHSIAKRHGYEYKGQVLGETDNYHHFVRRDLEHHRSRRSLEHSQQLESDSDIITVTQLSGFKRSKRGFKDLKELFNTEDFKSRLHKPAQEQQKASWSKFNDPLISKQWYLKNTGQADGQPGLDLNVEAAWAKGYTGKGVTIAIMDDGIDYLHPDLATNYNEQASYDFSSDDALPYPRYTDDWFNSHGTRCAGEVSAVADNGICGVGIAYHSKVAGIRMLDQPFMTDLIEASSMRHKPQLIDIYSASWGPQDNGRTVDGPRDLTLNAIAEGVNKGRGGKGSIYVWASGDGGPTDDCNCDGYASSMWTISINSAINDGRTALYDESCSSTLASTFSNGRNRHPEAGVATTDLYGNCTLAHSGTSAAAPEAAGVFALALEANPDLTWRDVQHLIVLTSKQNKLYDENYKWQCNGVGLEFNHLFGFGVLDAGAMVTLAEKWTTVPERFHCTGAKFEGVREIPNGLTGETTVLTLSTDACEGQEGYVRYLEHAQAIISLNSTKRGDVTLYMTSPMGTRSILLSEREEDYDSEDGFRHWPFMTTHTWGEDPSGEWVLEVEMTPGSENIATLTEWTLVLHGTQEAPYIEDLKPASSCVKNKEEVYETKNITTLGENGLPIVVPNEDFDKPESEEEGEGDQVSRVPEEGEGKGGEAGEEEFDDLEDEEIYGAWSESEGPLLGGWDSYEPDESYFPYVWYRR